MSIPWSERDLVGIIRLFASTYVLNFCAIIAGILEDSLRIKFSAVLMFALSLDA